MFIFMCISLLQSMKLLGRVDINKNFQEAVANGGAKKVLKTANLNVQKHVLTTASAPKTPGAAFQLASLAFSNVCEPLKASSIMTYVFVGVCVSAMFILHLAMQNHTQAIQLSTQLVIMRIVPL
jgi:hypothetical protein